MEAAVTIGLDLGKSVFQVHGVNREGVVIVQRRLTRARLLAFLLSRRSPKIAAVALANKMARMIWAMMVTGERYREPVLVRSAG